MKLYGLIGNPLTHSLSADYFKKKFTDSGLPDHDYHLFPIQHTDNLKQFINSKPELHGLNVTIPHKISVIQHLDEIDEDAKMVGAVNTIKIVRRGSKLHLTGYNTDIYGFRKMLSQHLELSMKRAIILGSGGASKAVEYVIKDLGIEYNIVSRSPQSPDQISYSELGKAEIEASDIIINTTPVGMYPDTETAPHIPYQYISSKHLVIDLIYNPEKTKFLSMAEERGASIVNGIEMFHFQAEKAWKIFDV